jgi:hypothetical protein
MNSTRFRMPMAATVAAVLGVLFAGQAGAVVRIDDLSGPHGVPVPDFVDRYVASHTSGFVRPDDRAELRGPGASSQLSYPDFVDRYVASHTGDVTQTAQASPESRSAQGFDWGAAGLGASLTAALLLALGTTLGFARRSRGRSAAV